MPPGENLPENTTEKNKTPEQASLRVKKKKTCARGFTFAQRPRCSNRTARTNINEHNTAMG